MGKRRKRKPSKEVRSVALLFALGLVGYRTLCDPDKPSNSTVPSPAATAVPASSPLSNQFAPYNINIGDGIMVINRELGRTPSFTIPLERGYVGKPALDAYYDSPSGYFRFLYYIGRSVDGGPISRAEFERKKRESLLY